MGADRIKRSEQFCEESQWCRHRKLKVYMKNLALQCLKFQISFSKPFLTGQKYNSIQFLAIDSIILSFYLKKKQFSIIFDSSKKFPFFSKCIKMFEFREKKFASKKCRVDTIFCLFAVKDIKNSL